MRLAHWFSAFSLLVPPAAADVLIWGQPGSYDTLQAAVDAAVDGDTLLIEPGLYASTIVYGKGLHLHGLPGGSAQIRGMLMVGNLPATSVFTLSDVVIDWNSSNVPQNEVDALRLEACAGQVRVERCTLNGSFHHQNFQNVARGAGLRATGCPEVAVSASKLRGADVGSLAGFGGSHAGGDGLLSVDSLVALYDCEIRGGTGSDETHPGGKGGAGARVTGWGMFASGTSIQGGWGGGGDYIGCTKSGDGGTGLIATSAQLQWIDTTAKGGPHGTFSTCGPGQDGQDVQLFSASLVDYPFPARTLSGPRSSDDNETLTLTVEGAAGDQVWILRGREPAFQPTGGPLGVLLVPKLWVLPAAPMGVVPASGTLDVTVWTADFVGPQPGYMLYAQALIVDANGQVRLSGPLNVLVRNT